MKVRVKNTQAEGFYGFYGLARRYPGDKFDLVEREIPCKKSATGKRTLTCEEQFSDKWMEKMEEETKRKRRSKEEMEADNGIKDSL